MKLYEARRDRLLTQRELGELSGVSYVTIARIESGLVVPTLRTIRRLSTALNVDPHSIEEFHAAIRGTELAPVV